MKSHKKLFVAIIIVMIITLIGSLFIGCKSDDEASGTLRVFLYEPVSLDPPYSWEQEGIKVINQVWDGLVKYNPETLEVEPSIAETWVISDDNLVYTFSLRKGVKFHSGRELIAEDFVYSWTRAVLKENAADLATLLMPIVGFEECHDGTATVLKGVKAIDDYTLEVTLKEPFADFINVLYHSVFYPIAKEDIEEFGDKYTENINGTGPFKFVEWKHDTYIQLERNDDYWGDKALLSEVKFLIFSDENTAFLEFQAENIEYTPIPYGSLQAVKDDPELKDNTIIKPLLSFRYVGLNINAEPFKDNKALREAINYIVDKQNICDIISEGTFAPATGIVAPGIKGFQENATDITFDLEKASDKLAEANYPDGEGLPVLKIGIDPNSPLTIIFEAIQADAKKVGVNIEIEPMDWDTAVNNFQKGELHFFGLGWAADYPTMDNFIFPLFYSEGTDNFTMYSNSRVDELILEARRTLDEDKRIEMYQEAEKIIMDDSVIIPMFFSSSRDVYQPYVKGLVFDSMGNYDLSKVWLEGE